MFQKVGLVRAWPDTRDRGRYEITMRDTDWMIFRVPSLRNVTRTAPYFHDGSVTSLQEAIRMMARHQIGRELGDEDVGLIAGWLDTLTGECGAAM
jgi:cytochrome c peroxidase